MNQLVLILLISALGDVLLATLMVTKLFVVISTTTFDETFIAQLRVFIRQNNKNKLTDNFYEESIINVLLKRSAEFYLNS